MKAVFLLSLVAGSVWAFARYAPEPWREAAFERTGLARVFGEKLPAWARSRFTIPASAEEKRKVLMADLSRELGKASEKLEALADEDVKNLTAAEVRSEAAVAREAIRKTESLVNEAVSTASEGGLVSRSVGRILDALLPSPDPAAVGSLPETCPPEGS